MQKTVNLDLPYIMPSQAQKHVTHNEALEIIDVLLQCAVVDRGISVPPSSPAEGDRHIVGVAASGAWSGHDLAIAVFRDGGWHFVSPRKGFFAWVIAEARPIFWTGSAWYSGWDTVTALQNLALLGLGTEADSENTFAARLNKALWTALPADAGGTGDLRYTLNKSASANVLSLLMQSGWSGRAEIGLVGDDDLSAKVSADGSTWKEALRLNRSSGAVSFPNTPSLGALASVTGEAGAFPRYTGAGSAVMQPILGTVSQDGGVPTGALIESGSNGNGRYVRFASGLQICTQRHSESGAAISSGFGGGYRSSIFTWTFPVAFAPGSTSEIVFTGSTRFTAFALTTETQSVASGRFFFVAPASQTAADRQAELMAVGRWF